MQCTIGGHGMKIAIRILVVQLGIALFSAALWSFFEGGRAGFAALVGGGISLVLTGYTAIRTFAVPAADAQRAVTNFYRAQVRKMFLAGALFAVAARFLSDVYVPVIVTFALTLTVFMLALLWETSDG